MCASEISRHSLHQAAPNGGAPLYGGVVDPGYWVIVTRRCQTDGDFIKIELRNAGIIWDGSIIRHESSNLNSIKQMFEGKHEKDGSWYQCKLVSCTEGKYQIQLISSTMAMDDIKAIIATVKNPITGGDILLDTPDHFVFVKKNGKVIFTTGDLGDDCGEQKIWVNLTFEIQWKPWDKIEVGFDESNPAINSHIFLKTDNTENSLDLLNGQLSGGKSNSSNVRFARKELK